MAFDIRWVEGIFLQKIKKKYRLYDLNKYKNYKLSFSQEGEDMVLSRFLEGDRKNGFYVDIGAHNPQRFSNTYHFYLHGWSGINIDAMPGSMAEFRRIRPNDINLEQAISSKQEIVDYYIFEESALNTLDKEVADKYVKNGWPLRSKRPLKTSTLVDVLDTHLPAGKTIDLMTIDVEGYDYDVLLSNDWNKYRPTFVLIEILENQDIERVLSCETYKFLYKNGYRLVAKTFNTVFFRCQ